MQPIARKDDRTLCIALLPLPHISGKLFNAMPICLHANGKPIIRLADYATCLFGPLDVVAEGAATFLVCGLPVARRLDHMIHGGFIAQGSSNVEVGGPTFAMPANFKIKGPPEFQNLVLRDLYFLSTTRSGQALLKELGDKGFPLEIIPEADPHNSFASPMDGDASTNGTGTGSVVKYNPDVAVIIEDSDGTHHPESPQLILGHELIHAMNNAQGDRRTGKDPHPPDRHKTINWEESETIGTGSGDGNFPSENTLREDLGQPRRDTHYGWTDDEHGNELTTPPLQQRPGAC